MVHRDLDAPKVSDDVDDFPGKVSQSRDTKPRSNFSYIRIGSFIYSTKMEIY